MSLLFSTTRRDDEILFWVPLRHCSISADITGQQQGDQWT